MVTELKVSANTYQRVTTLGVIGFCGMPYILASPKSAADTRMESGGKNGEQESKIHQRHSGCTEQMI